MNDKIEAGRRVASRLFTAEDAIDEALIAAAALQVSLIEARQETGLPCGTIQAALNDAVAASAALMEARRAMVGTHRKIVKLRDDLGLDENDFGCVRVCLSPSHEAKETSQLKAVHHTLASGEDSPASLLLLSGELLTTESVVEHLEKDKAPAMPGGGGMDGMH